MLCVVIRPQHRGKFSLRGFMGMTSAACSVTSLFFGLFNRGCKKTLRSYRGLSLIKLFGQPVFFSSPVTDTNPHTHTKKRPWPRILLQRCAAAAYWRVAICGGPPSVFRDSPEGSNTQKQSGHFSAWKKKLSHQSHCKKRAHLCSTTDRAFAAPPRLLCIFLLQLR